VNDTLPGVDSVSTRVTSSEPVIAERAMYWRPPIERRLGQLFMIGFDGTALTPEVESLISTVRPGGVILFARNIVSPDQLKKLTSDLQNLSVQVSGFPLLISTDQEGGMVRRVTWLDDAVSQADITSTEQAYWTALNRATGLRDLGINHNLAPVVDRGIEGDLLSRQGRCFKGSTEQVGLLGKSMVEGQKAGGILSTAKHFPGYGGIDFDTEHGRLAVVPGVPEISQFEVMSGAGPEFVMSVAGVFYNSLDPDLVFTLSPRGIELLKESVSGNTLVISDDLGTDTMNQAYTLKGTVVLAVKAGVDVLLVCHAPNPIQAYGHLLAAVRNGEIAEGMIDERFSRIVRLKQRYFSNN
jgi:beta-N-acetylhexosaminidase